jgi:hypothetical protein
MKNPENTPFIRISELQYKTELKKEKLSREKRLKIGEAVGIKKENKLLTVKKNILIRITRRYNAKIQQSKHIAHVVNTHMEIKEIKFI